MQESSAPYIVTREDPTGESLKISGAFASATDAETYAHGLRDAHPTGLIRVTRIARHTDIQWEADTWYTDVVLNKLMNRLQKTMTQ